MLTFTKLYLTGVFKDQQVIHRTPYYKRPNRFYSDNYGYYRLIKVR